MRTVLQLYEDFNMEFSNYPINFEDEIIGDGLVTNFQLTFYPILELGEWRPKVYKNTGTYASPVWTLQVENTDYRINFETGQLDFISGAPSEILDTNSARTISAKVTAFHCKLNLKQFLNFWNQNRQSMTIFFPKRTFVKMTETELGVTEWTRLDQLDLTVSPWTEYYNIEQFFQNHDDNKHVPFFRRDTTLVFDRNNNEEDLRYVIWPSDYYRWPFKSTQSINTPFWVYGIKYYPYFELSGVDPNTYIASETYLDYDKWAVRNCIMRIGVDMYRQREWWSERMNAATLRLATLKDIQMTKMSLSQDLMRHTSENAPWRGTTPPISWTN